MQTQTPARRPVHCRRSWLFLPGADEAALLAGPSSQADVLMQEFEDFTTPANRPQARRLAPTVIDQWRRAGVLCAVRINPLDSVDGPADLAAVMAARPDIIAMPKVNEAAQIVRLDQAIGRLESVHGIATGSTEILPNIESARGLVNLAAIAAASERVNACLLASEDLATDLGAERHPDALELAYARQRFLLECRAAGVEAVDFPYTWSSGTDVLIDEINTARRFGFRAKSCVHPPHAALINQHLSPSQADVDQAMRLVAAFEQARADGRERVLLDGSLVELPTYTHATRLLARHRQLQDWAG